jgi:hypothetical protein
MANKIVRADTPDEFAILTAAWILASNDENPIMTYKGIVFRLDLPKNYNVKRIVNSRGELFRRGVPEYRLRELKKEWIAYPRKRSSWIRVMGDEGKQIEAIQALTTEDVFRSQFRAVIGAQKSPIEIIDWGLQHIERLRKASMDSKDQYAKSKEVRWVLVVSIITAIISVISVIAVYIKPN